MTNRILSIDIETVPKEGYQIDFEDPAAWLPFAVSLGFRPFPDATPETTVLLRDGSTCHEERRLFARVVNWVRDREPHDALVTYNGESYDLPILAERAAAVADPDIRTPSGLDWALKDALDVPHRDLLAEIKELQDPSEKWPSLDESLAARDIPSTTAILEGDVLDGSAMPALGRKVLAGELTPEERTALRHYCESDVRPLFALADRLDRERVADAEASATLAGESATGGHDA